MSDRYKAEMENQAVVSDSPKYWKVTIEANSLNDLNNLCNAIKMIRDGGKQ